MTIVYPGGRPTFWDFLCGRTQAITVRVRQLPIPAEFCSGDYAQDPVFRSQFQRWLDQIWQEKDLQIEGILQVS